MNIKIFFFNFFCVKILWGILLYIDSDANDNLNSTIFSNFQNLIVFITNENVDDLSICLLSNTSLSEKIFISKNVRIYGYSFLIIMITQF